MGNTNSGKNVEMRPMSSLSAKTTKGYLKKIYIDDLVEIMKTEMEDWNQLINSIEQGDVKTSQKKQLREKLDDTHRMLEYFLNKGVGPYVIYLSGAHNVQIIFFLHYSIVIWKPMYCAGQIMAGVISLVANVVLSTIDCWPIYEYIVENVTITSIWCLLVYVSWYAGYVSLLILFLVNGVG